METGKYRSNFELSFFVAMDTDKIGSGGGFFSLYGLYRNVRPQRVRFFQPFWSEIEHPFWPFGSQIGYGFCNLIIELGTFSLEEANISSLSIRPSTKALHNAFDIGLNWGTVRQV